MEGLFLYWKFHVQCLTKEIQVLSNFAIRVCVIQNFLMIPHMSFLFKGVLPLGLCLSKDFSFVTSPLVCRFAEGGHQVVKGLLPFQVLIEFFTMG